MRIKKLHISGFKSFCHPVEVQFQQSGITVIVGPNGCGKSNVVDAIRWVLGEQSAKHLRGGEMGDVIFAGSEYQKPVGMAEVTLTFNNFEGNTLPKYQEFSEISIGRRLYRSGESVYLINKNPVRLMDVRELFMDTGVGTRSYAIIEQGKVGEIVSGRPADRRFLIEEAAGIVKFKTKRQTAEKRLDSTQQNLLRVDDILQELIRQEETLRGQVEQATHYLQMRDESERIDQQLSTLRWHNARKKEQLAEAKVTAHKQRQAALLDQRGSQETQLEQSSLKLAQQSKQLEALREALFQKERDLQEAENQKNLERQNLRNHEEWITQHTQEISELRGRMGVQHEQLASVQQEMGDLELHHGNLISKVENIETARQEEEDILHSLNEEVQDFQKRLLQIHTQLTNYTNQKNFLEERLDNLEEREERFKEQARLNLEHLRQAETKTRQTQSQVESYQAKQTQLQQTLQELQTQSTAAEQEYAVTETALQETQYALSTTRSHIESLETIQGQYEDFDEGVKSFLQLLKDAPEEKQRLGILGVLAEFLSIAPEAMPKVSPALADYLELIVVETADHLTEIEGFCQQYEVGRLGFLSLDTQGRFPQTMPPTHGKPLGEYVQFAEPIADLEYGFFSQIYIVESEATWELLPAGEESFLNLEWISPQGSYHTRYGVTKIGKTRETSFGFLQRKAQIEELLQKAVILQSDVEDLQAQLTGQKQRRQELLEQTEHAKATQHTYELELSRFHKELEHDELEQRRAAQLVKQLNEDIQQLQSEIQKARLKLHEMEEKHVELEEERMDLEGKMAHHQESIQVQRRLVEEVSSELLATRVALTEVTEQLKNKQETLERLRQESTEGRKRLTMLESAQNDSEQKIQRTQQAIANLETQSEALVTGREEMQQTLAEQSSIYTEMTQLRSNSSSQLQEMNKELDELLMKIHEESLQATEQRLQREQMEQQLVNAYGKSPQEFLHDLDLENLNLSSLSGRLKNLRVQMNAMSNVNLGAPDEYAALKERMDFLQQQSADLQQAIDDLRKTIREINIESRRRFQETFELVNKNFKEMFTELFGGGEAKMVLTDADDVLEAGVDIIASPPGKKLQNLNLLSGGEKALTAISLIFAIFLLKPSPFCLLDEVDAPLDEANVGRFTGMIRKMTENSQFIMITHNKKSMEIGDLLYGVTMEEPGISKTVSVQFHDAAAMIN